MRKSCLHTTNASGALSTVSDMYIDGLVLRNGTPHTWQYDGGYITLDANGAATSWNYYVTDHLGSTRKVVTSTNAVKETINYYPYGSEMTMTVPSQLTTNPDWQPFRFSGKELDKVNGLNMYDFGARWFDVAGVPAWTSVDPLAEDNCRVTPYSYCNGDPVNRVDPDGRDYWSTNDPDEILQFLNAVGSGKSQFDFSGWSHATDAEFCGNLVYNDESHKFYTSYAEVTNGEIVVTSKSFDANITPVSTTGMGYPGAFVYEPVNGFWENANYYLNGLTYNDGFTNWNVNRSGRITGAAPIIGMPPSIGFKGGKQVEKMGRAFRNMTGNRNVQQKQIDQLSSKYQLSKKQRRKLHDNIHGEGLGYNEIEELIKELFY